MPLYFSINGIPSCANKELLMDIARGEWGFRGYIMSDAGAIDFIRKGHNYTQNDLETVTMAIRAGCNQELELDKQWTNIYLKQVGK